jgi:hypothetical protein
VQESKRLSDVVQRNLSIIGCEFLRPSNWADTLRFNRVSSRFDLRIFCR